MAKENFVHAYFQITQVNSPAPTGIQRGGRPTYNVRAKGISVVGYNPGGPDSTAGPEVRETDLLFTDLTDDHARRLTPNCEVSIFGASVYSYDAQLKYSRSHLGPLAPEGDSPYLEANEIAEHLTKLLNLDSTDHFSKVIPSSRRVSVVRAKPGEWQLRASPVQVKEAQRLAAQEVSFGEV